MTSWVSSNDRFFQKKKKQPVSQEKSIKKVGFFSTKTGFTFKDMEHGNVVSFVTRPGSHMNNAFVGDFDVMETMVKFALEVGVDDLVLPKASMPATFPAKQCPPPPINWVIVLVIVASCLFCCGSCYHCLGSRYHYLSHYFKPSKNVKTETETLKYVAPSVALTEITQ